MNSDGTLKLQQTQTIHVVKETEMTDMQKHQLTQIEKKEEDVDQMLDQIGSGINILMQQANEISEQV